jgi:hypothetical protein
LCSAAARHVFPVEEQQVAVFRGAKLLRAPKDRVENGLDLAGRTADDAQDLRRRRLLFQSFCQLARTCLHLLEELRIVHGNHGLVGEGLN